jgi:hypothetical protein
MIHLDRRWSRHTTAKLQLRDSISILPLPSRSPKLNPIENLWQYMRQYRLSNRVVASYGQIVACVAMPGTACATSPARHVHRTPFLGPCMINCAGWHNTALEISCANRRTSPNGTLGGPKFGCQYTRPQPVGAQTSLAKRVAGRVCRVGWTRDSRRSRCGGI